MTDERAYRVEVRFLPETEKFVAAIPELSVSAEAEDRGAALGALEAALEAKVQSLAEDGDSLPEPLDLGPVEPLTLTLAPAVARDLRHLAARAQMDMDALATQLLVHAISGASAAPARRPPPEARSERGAPEGGARRGRGRGRGQGPRREGYRRDLDDKANFLEYLRGLDR